MAEAKRLTNCFFKERTRKIKPKGRNYPKQFGKHCVKRGGTKNNTTTGHDETRKGSRASGVRLQRDTIQTGGVQYNTLIQYNAINAYYRHPTPPTSIRLKNLSEPNY